MSFANKKGIALAGGFKLQAEAPLDARLQVDSIADRDELVTIHAAWEGMRVYVKADKKSYEYKGSGVWDPVLTGTMYTHPGTHPATMITEDSTHRFMTDNERTKLQGIAAGANKYTHPSTHSLDMITETDTKKIMTATERAKLNGIADGANKYTHPSTHSADMITDSTKKVMMTVEERNKLSGISGGANAYTHPSTHPATMITEDETHRFMTDDERTKLQGIAAGANAYTHPTSSGNKHIPAGGASGQILRWSADGTAVWGNDNNTTYGVVTANANGLMSPTLLTKLNGIAAGANNYTHPTSSGNKHIPSGGSSGQILRWSADGTAVWGNDNNTTYSAFKAATASAAGGQGLVPAPAAGAQTKYLRADGTWQYPPNTTYGVVTTSANGLMSPELFNKLNGIAAGANNYTHPSSHPASMITQDATHRFVSDTEKNTWNAKVNKSTKSTVTLTAANWVAATTGHKYTLSVSGVTASNNVEVVLPGSATDAQVEAWMAAGVACGTQTTNSITLRAFGDKPGINIPLEIIIRKDI